MSLRVAEHIYGQLNGSTALKAKVGTRIYPVNAPEGAGALPFVIFDTQTGEPDYTKDGAATDSHQVTVYCMSKEYMTELMPMAEAVRKALELVTEEYDDYEVTECTMLNASDDWLEELGCYVYTLTFALTSEDTE